jgi:hypothetical protein
MGLNASGRIPDYWSIDASMVPASGVTHFKHFAYPVDPDVRQTCKICGGDANHTIGKTDSWDYDASARICDGCFKLIFS